MARSDRRALTVCAMGAAVVAGAWMAEGQADVTLTGVWERSFDQVRIETLQIRVEGPVFRESDVVQPDADRTFPAEASVEVPDASSYFVLAIVETPSPAASLARPRVTVERDAEVSVDGDTTVTFDYCSRDVRVSVTATAETPAGVEPLDLVTVDVAGVTTVAGERHTAEYLAAGPDLSTGAFYLPAIYPRPELDQICDDTANAPPAGYTMAVDGEVTVRIPGGALRVVPVSASVAVEEDGADLELVVDVDLVSASAIEGDLALGAPTGGPQVRDHVLRATGEAPLAGGFLFETTVAAGATSYSLPVDRPGGYTLGATTFFEGPYGWAEWPDAPLALEGRGPGPLVVFGDSVTREDLDDTLGVVEVQVDGGPQFVGTALAGASIRAVRDDGRGAFRASDAEGTVALAGFGGELRVEEVAVTASDALDGTRRDATYARAPLDGTRLDVVAGVITTADPVSLALAEAVVVFDPATVPGLGAGTAFTNPVVTGTREVRDAEGALVEVRSFRAEGRAVTQSLGYVRVVAEPGTYVATAVADVGGAPVLFRADFTLEVVAASPTPLGAATVTGPEAAPLGEQRVSLAFEDVTAAGVTTIREVPTGPPLPADFALAGSIYDIETTAEFTRCEPPAASTACGVVVCIELDASVATGDLRLHHFVDDAWTDITDEALSDFTVPVVCGRTSSFSPFAVLIAPEADSDTDGDGVPDDEDVCPEVSDPEQVDLDGDGDGDACDLDDDGDGADDDEDNCPITANADQADLDGDGAGDPCDDDDDGDEVPDDEDVCPDLPDAEQADSDGDGDGDACDTDDDGDGVEDVVDNCPLVPNADQADADADGVGDACGSDEDGDGVADADDLCAETPADRRVDTDGCSGAQRVANACRPEDFRRRGRYVACVAREASAARRDGLLTAREAVRLVVRATRAAWCF